MNLLVIGIGIGHEKDLIIGYRFKFFISCIPIYNVIPLLFLSTFYSSKNPEKQCITVNALVSIRHFFQNH